jgi:hypothetical protein
VLWGIALVALALGIVGAIYRGYLGRRPGCQSWVNGHGYALLHNDWWTKDRGCVARTPDGIEVIHSESLDSKATGWAWQFAIFAAGTLPAAGTIA